MKVSALIVAAAVGLASAAPMRIVMITSPRTSGNSIPTAQEDNPFHVYRLGHAAASATIARPTPGVGLFPMMSTPGGHAGGCGGLRAKMDRLSAKAREMFGLAPIHPVPYRVPGHQGYIDEALIKAMMMGSGGVEPSFVGGPGFVHTMPVVMRPMHEDRFMFRFHRALNQLGPWEGRAVSFVLGCGLGVLLRMFFVLFVLLIRARRSSRQSNAGPIHLPQEPEIVYVTGAPPQYIVEEAMSVSVGEKKEGPVVIAA